MLPASSAASIGSVPDPHMKSTSGDSCVPAGKPQDAGGQDFVERGFVRLAAIAAFVQRLVGRIEVDGHAAGVDVQIDPQVGPLLRDIRPPVETSPEPIADCVLGDLRGVHGIGDRRVMHHRIDGQRAAGMQMRSPINLLQAGIQHPGRIGGLRIEFERGDRFEDPHGGAAPDIGPIQQFLIADE